MKSQTRCRRTNSPLQRINESQSQITIPVRQSRGAGIIGSIRLRRGLVGPLRGGLKYVRRKASSCAFGSKGQPLFLLRLGLDRNGDAHGVTLVTPDAKVNRSAMIAPGVQNAAPATPPPAVQIKIRSIKPPKIPQNAVHHLAAPSIGAKEPSPPQSRSGRKAYRASRRCGGGARVGQIRGRLPGPPSIELGEREPRRFRASSPRGSNGLRRLTPRMR